MGDLLDKVKSSPLLVRAVPFLLFAGMTALQGKFGEASRYWVYFVKTLLGLGMLALVYRSIPETKWRFSIEAVAVGILVFAIWVFLDPFYPKLGGAQTPWNPHAQFGANSSLAFFFVVARILGSTFVVPPLEEVFYRSFLYRYMVKVDFASVPFSFFAGTPFLVVSIVFGVAHFEWLAGILCGFLYLGLMIRKNRLGDSITAHAITNCLLGLWIVWKGAWHFW